MFFARRGHTIDEDFTRDQVVQKVLVQGRVFCLLMGLACLQTGVAEQPASQQPLSTYIVRTGEQLQAPHVLTYRMVEYSQQWGRWIVPDVGYYDTGHANDALWFAGVGAEIYHGERVTWTQEVYAAEEAGSAAHNQHTLWIWPVLDLRFTPRLSSQTVVYPTVPLNKAARWGLDVDRSKVEYAVRPHLRAGVGYGSSKCADQPWENKPFLTATATNRTGAWEFWMQRVTGGAQIQVRYQLDRRGY